MATKNKEPNEPKNPRKGFQIKKAGPDNPIFKLGYVSGSRYAPIHPKDPRHSSNQKAKEEGKS